MDPSRNDFNGSGLPLHGRQGHGQDQGQQQLPGFPFQFQNHHLAAISGIERTRELRELQDQIILRQELERRQRALSEQQELMSQIVEGKYTQLTRQGNDSNFHRQQPFNLQPAGGRMVLAQDEIRRLQQVAAHRNQQRQQRQKAHAAVQQALLQQQEQHRKERQQQHELHELSKMKQHELHELHRMKLQQMQNRKLQEMLLKRMQGGNPGFPRDAIDNENYDESIENLIQNRTRTFSVGDNISLSQLALQRQRSEDIDTNMKLRDAERLMDGDGFPLEGTDGPDFDSLTRIQNDTEGDMKLPAKNYDMDTDEEEESKVNESQSNVDEQDKLDESLSDGKQTSEVNATIDALIKAAEHTEAKNRDMNGTTCNGGPEVSTILKVVKKVFTDDEAAELIHKLKAITNRDPTAAAYFGIQDLEHLEIAPGKFTVIPKLPEEPNFDESEMRKEFEEQMIQTEEEEVPETNETEHVRRDVIEPTFLDNPIETIKQTFDAPPHFVDTWFPQSTSIRRERRMQGIGGDEKEVKLGTTKAENILISEEMNKRLRSEIEPGVLEKLSHCKVYTKWYMEQYGKLPKEPVYCFQVSESFCKSPMLCCSVCSTWRHAECGGHFTHYSSNCTDANFAPVCDRCHFEKDILNHYPIAEKRLARQRSIQIRSVHAITAIMRNSAYAKHGGTYKWPLGSVSKFHIGSHTKTIHMRQERSEKQWKEMSAKLNSRNNRKSNRAKIRTRDFERLMVNLEDAEGQTDRHNMTLFLEWDTARENPVGFEKPLSNFFDPAEDEQGNQFNFENLYADTDNNNDDDDDDEEDDESKNGKNKENGIDSHTSPSTYGDIESHHNDNCNNVETRTKIASFSGQDESRGRIRAKRTRSHSSSPKRQSNYQCIRIGCNKKPRFDSNFCSDACGIATMEEDLLASLRYADEMHPYQLRP